MNPGLPTQDISTQAKSREDFLAGISMFEEMGFASIDEAIDEIRKGRFVVVADDEGRENEGDLICAAELVTPAMINFMITEARGWVCLALNQERARELNLPMMVDQNTESQGTAF